MGALAKNIYLKLAPNGSQIAEGGDYKQKLSI